MDILLADKYEIIALKEMADDWFERNHRLVKKAFSKLEMRESLVEDEEILIAGESVCRYIRGLG